uniref:Uncharacterized protein n=1 Tax=Candidatus Giovannonibacteria bacterium GW2011_GWF2_42_19 TaxID=1618659 RepID=A0A0G1CHC2_9BACT|nr:MAG: hypothetical protein UV11_C0001G0068 [Candidatus Giovannonibacteria bacterium GW2011_GWF2_42_19]
MKKFARSLLAISAFTVILIGMAFSQSDTGTETSKITTLTGVLLLVFAIANGVRHHKWAGRPKKTRIGGVHGTFATVWRRLL